MANPHGKWADNDTERPPEPPAQYGPGRCVCGTRLSTYNPFFTCGPCRVKTTASVAATIAEGDADEMPAITFEWEGGPRRRPLRRGPLLDTTLAE
jgi:hypothetical protein